LTGPLLYRFPQLRGALNIRGEILADRIHRLPYPGICGKVINVSYALEGRVNRGRIANIPDPEVDVGVQIGWPVSTFTVNLRYQRVNRANMVTGRE
jgi:hypothetical protein